MVMIGIKCELHVTEHKRNYHFDFLLIWLVYMHTYHIGEKFGEIGESSMICQTKAIQISIYN